ncbi:hypothetical protein [Anaerosolibacter sp.]|uniref:hypothetical protein n=1 Tax=Anaerosolibacter sp. TaxID=1872527 RepID=UPI0039EF3D19
MNMLGYGFPIMGGLFFLVYLGIMIYMIYLFHVLATSNRKIAESMEILVHKIDKLTHRDPQ